MTALPAEGYAPPVSLAEALERLVFVNERLRTLRRRLGRREEQGMVDRIVAEVNAVRVALPDLTVPAQKRQVRRKTGDRRARNPGWQTKNRVNATGEEERFCPRHHAGHGAWVPSSHFDVKDPVKGTLRYCCRDCWREYQRERYVAANRRAIIVEVVDGDRIVGAYCNGCGQPFEVGDIVVGSLPRHQECCPTPLEPVT